VIFFSDRDVDNPFGVLLLIALACGLIVEVA
jgi:hypothetical protein